MTTRDAPQMDDPERAQIEGFLNEAQSPDEIAYAYLSLGTMCERREDWNGAVDSYSKALCSGSLRADFCYFGNNNLGYSLIQLGRFNEAEGYCLSAIEVEPNRHNAHKNLGLVRQGQERFQEAAFCFVEAYRRCPSDQRAWHLLMALLSGHSELITQSEDLRIQISEFDQRSVNTPLTAGKLH
jgi:Flp pilus assembly protein TadD